MSDTPRDMPVDEALAAIRRARFIYVYARLAPGLPASFRVSKKEAIATIELYRAGTVRILEADSGLWLGTTCQPESAP